MINIYFKNNKINIKKYFGIININILIKIYKLIINKYNY